MNPQDDQGNSPPPDYSFLAEQPLPTASVPKKRNPKIILMIVLGVLAVIVASASVLVPKKKSATQPTANTANTELVKTFLSDAAAGNIDKVRGAYAGSATKDRETVDLYVVKPLSDTYVLTNCEVKDGKLKDTVRAACPTKKTGKKIGFDFIVVSTPDGPKITETKIVGSI